MRRAGLARSTFYRHHRTVREIMPDYEKYIMFKFRRVLRRAMKSDGVEMRGLYLQMLIFIVQHGRIFEMFVKRENRGMVRKMVQELQPKIDRVMRLPKNAGEIFNVYTSEVVEVIWQWGLKGFSELEIEMTLGDIMFLTNTARQRLRPLLREN